MWHGREKTTISSNEVKHNPMAKPGPAEYPHRLNFYDIPPTQDITIEEFEMYAIDRLRVLGEIESSFARNRPPDELKTITRTQYQKYIPLDPNYSERPLDDQRRKDHIGHFVLRLAFCRSEELRRRFVKAECMLFRVRFDDDDPNERKHFLASRDFGWVQVDDTEKTKYYSELKAASMKNFVQGARESHKFDVKDETYYKVKWTRVQDLVERRRVFLRGGWAYVPGKEQSSIVFQEFQARLEKALEVTAKALPRLDEDTRLVPILNNLSQGFLSGVPSEWNSPEGSGEDVKASMVDDIAQKHYPACMHNLHDNLRRDRHLKHFGRLQYGLFLKALGLSIDEALLFWRKSFSKYTDDQFNKNYKYNIRHSYGLEGRRANYPAKSCQQILTQDTPGTNDSHGCPYRHFSADNLQSALLSMYSPQGLTTADLPEVMNIVKAGHYHVACTRVFEITHGLRGVQKGEGVGGGESVTHPNQYVTKSRELERAQADKRVEADGDVVMGS
ncbi:DNA primase large subunit [Amylostereum chailletii]|nr:DNA primase large subunit [Amylostereum chailletii]